MWNRGRGIRNLLCVCRAKALQRPETPSSQAASPESDPLPFPFSVLPDLPRTFAAQASTRAHCAFVLAARRHGCEEAWDQVGWRSADVASGETCMTDRTELVEAALESYPEG